MQDEAEAFQCSHCYYARGNWEQFEQHMNVGHKLAPLFPCRIPSCWTYYQSKNGLKGHCRHLHSNLLSCSLCNHVAVGTTALQEHERNHSEKKFPCDACNQGFSSHYDMRRHFEKCPKNPDRKISCKQCTAVGAHVEVSGGISGIITHCICCDIGQIDIFSRIELFPLSSCQVIILIARMTFNCSTSCLMS